MEKKMKGIRVGNNNIDDLATVKAAAWAWYQHGSRSEGRPVREFDVTRTRQAPKPTRYRLEAMRMMEDTREGSSQAPSPVRSDTSLLDTFEVESISKQLDCLIESSRNRFYGRLFDNIDLCRQRSVSSDGGYSTSTAKKKFLKGLWLRHAVACGTRKDVDTRAFIVRRRPERHAEVASSSPASIPRAAHAH